MEAQFTQGGNHFAGNHSAGFQTKAFAQCSANGRRRLHNYCLGWIVEGCPNILNLVAFRDGAHGTYCRTLAALHTNHIVQIAGEGGADNGGKTASLRENAAHTLGIVAHGDAPTAQNAFGGVTYQCGCAVVNVLLALFAGIGDIADSEAAC